MLDERKTKLVEYVMEGQTKTDAAKKIGVSRVTINEWLKDDDVKAAMEQWQKDIVDSSKKRLTNKVVTYIENLDDIANHSTDMRTKAQVNEYLLDRILGRISIAGEITEEKTDNLDDDILAKEIEDVDKLRLVK